MVERTVMSILLAVRPMGLSCESRQNAYVVVERRGTQVLHSMRSRRPPFLEITKFRLFSACGRVAHISREIKWMNMRRGNPRPQQRPPAAGHGTVVNRQRQNGLAGSAHRNYERYLALARDATLNGDIVEAENFYQHAEHYFRVMRERAA
jgi:hypothetical protein